MPKTAQEIIRDLEEIRKDVQRDTRERERVEREVRERNAERERERTPQDDPKYLTLDEMIDRMRARYNDVRFRRPK